MLKNHFGNIRDKSSLSIGMEKEVSNFIYDKIYNHLYEIGCNTSELTRFNPFLTNIMMKVSFLYLKTYSSKYIIDNRYFMLITLYKHYINFTKLM